MTAVILDDALVLDRLTCLGQPLTPRSPSQGGSAVHVSCDPVVAFYPPPARCTRHRQRKRALCRARRREPTAPGARQGSGRQPGWHNQMSRGLDPAGHQLAIWACMAVAAAPFLVFCPGGLADGAAASRVRGESAGRVQHEVRGTTCRQSTISSISAAPAASWPDIYLNLQDKLCSLVRDAKM
jgi:hypothetical protein